MKNTLIIVSTAIFLGVYNTCAFAETNDFIVAINEPCGDFQKSIDTIVSVFVAHENRTASEQDCNAALDNLLSSTTNSSSEILKQVLVYRSNTLDEYKDRASRILVWLLMQRTSDAQILDAIVPVYINETNDALTKQVKYVLDGITLKDGSNPNYDSFIPYLKEVANIPPSPLIRYMYSLSAKQAVITFEKVYSGDDSAFNIESIIEADDTQKMVGLLKQGDWWKCLYVAKKALQDPSIRNLETMSYLHNSDNPLVRETVAEIEKEINPGH